MTCPQDLIVRCRLAGVRIGPDGKPRSAPGIRPLRSLVAELQAAFPAVLQSLQAGEPYRPEVAASEIEESIRRAMQEYRRDDPRVRSIAREIVAERKREAWTAALSEFRGNEERPASALSAPFSPSPECGPRCGWCGLREFEDFGRRQRRCRVCREICDDVEQAPRPPPGDRIDDRRREPDLHNEHHRTDGPPCETTRGTIPSNSRETR